MSTKALFRIKFEESYGHNCGVIHRKRGDIPGCVPAVDTFIERTADEVHLHLMASADRYIYQMQTMKHQEWINSPLERALPAFR